MAKGGANPQHIPSMKQLELEAKVLEARASGLSFTQVAIKTGINDRGSAHRIYKRAMARVHKPAVDELRQLEGDRLDRLQAAAWTKAMNGNLRAIGSVLAVQRRRASLFGLDASHALAERSLEIEADRIQLIALSVGKVFDALELTEEQRARGIQVLFTELRAAEAAHHTTDPPPTDDDEDGPLGEIVAGSVDADTPIDA